MNVQLPNLDLSGFLPVAGPVLVVVLIGVFLLVRSLLNSRIALLIAVVIGVVAAGPSLANAVAAIVGALVPLGIVLVAGFVGSLFLLNRNFAQVMNLVREVFPRKQELSQPLPPATDRNAIRVVDQAPQVTRVRQIAAPKQPGDTWGGLR